MDGTPLVERLRAVLREHHEDYAAVLVPHLSRHLEAFGTVAAR